MNKLNASTAVKLNLNKHTTKQARPILKLAE